MVTLKEQVDIKAPYERMEAWANNFQEEFVRWSPYHTECEMYDGGYQKGMQVRFREIVGGLDYNVTGFITDLSYHIYIPVSSSFIACCTRYLFRKSRKPVPVDSLNFLER